MDIYDSRIQHLFIQYGERNIGWGSLHIVMDDGNLEDSNIQFCLDYALEEGDWDGVVLAYFLLKQSYEDREKLYDRY